MQKPIYATMERITGNWKVKMRGLSQEKIDELITAGGWIQCMVRDEPTEQYYKEIKNGRKHLRVVLDRYQLPTL